MNLLYNLKYHCLQYINVLFVDFVDYFWIFLQQKFCKLQYMLGSKQIFFKCQIYILFYYERYSISTEYFLYLYLSFENFYF